jgi:hypothetical protein
MRAAKAIAVLCLYSFTLPHAQAGSRKALIIGNNRYTASEFPKLDRAPINDADAMYQVLTSVGFDPSDVTVVYDLTRERFNTALHDFRQKLGDDDSVLFYFSGHGFSIDGTDFLVPIDFAFGNTREEARLNSISLVQIINLFTRFPNRVIILDACRTESQRWKQMSNGSSKADVDALVAPEHIGGSLIAYATSAGMASNARSLSGLSFYTQYLVNSIAAHPKDMLTALNNARDMTISASHETGKIQVPAIYNEMDGSFPLVSSAAPSLASNPETNNASTTPQRVPQLQITGRVIDKNKKSGVANSIIGMYGRPERTVTDEGGHFSLAVNPPRPEGNVDLFIGRDGYETFTAKVPIGNNLEVELDPIAKLQRSSVCEKYDHGLRHFYWQYIYDPAGHTRRDWYQQSPTVWNECYEDGRYNRLTVVEPRANLDGNEGVICKSDSSAARIFIPNVDANGMWPKTLRYQSSSTDPWVTLAELHEIGK